MKSLNRNAILKIKDLKRVEVEVPEWDSIIVIRELSLKDRLDFNDYVTNLKKDGETLTPANSLLVMAKLLVYSIVDDNDVKIFEDSDMEQLLSKSTTVLTRLSAKAMELLGVDNKTIEEVKANLKNDQVDSSVSD
jgi:hypothetical protein